MLKLYAEEVEDLSAENDEGNENNSEKQKEDDDTKKDKHIETRDMKTFKSDIEDKENVSHVMVNEYSRDLLTLCEFEILDHNLHNRKSHTSWHLYLISHHS